MNEDIDRKYMYKAPPCEAEQEMKSDEMREKVIEQAELESSVIAPPADEEEQLVKRQDVRERSNELPLFRCAYTAPPSAEEGQLLK